MDEEGGREEEGGAGWTRREGGRGGVDEEEGAVWTRREGRGGRDGVGKAEMNGSLKLLRTSTTERWLHAVLQDLIFRQEKTISIPTHQQIVLLLAKNLIYTFGKLHFLTFTLEKQLNQHIVLS